MEPEMTEDSGLNKGMNGGVPLSVLGAPKEEQCGEIFNLVVAVVKFEMPNKASLERRSEWRCRCESYQI